MNASTSFFLMWRLPERAVDVTAAAEGIEPVHQIGRVRDVLPAHGRGAHARQIDARHAAARTSARPCRATTRSSWGPRGRERAARRMRPLATTRDQRQHRGRRQMQTNEADRSFLRDGAATYFLDGEPSDSSNHLVSMPRSKHSHNRCSGDQWLTSIVRSAGKSTWDQPSQSTALTVTVPAGHDDVSKRAAKRAGAIHLADRIADLEHADDGLAFRIVDDRRSRRASRRPGRRAADG